MEVCSRLWHLKCICLSLRFLAGWARQFFLTFPAITLLFCAFLYRMNLTLKNIAYFEPIFSPLPKQHVNFCCFKMLSHLVGELGTYAFLFLSFATFFFWRGSTPESGQRTQRICGKFAGGYGPQRPEDHTVPWH